MALLLAGCAQALVVEPAQDGNDPACAPVLSRLPDTVDGLERRSTSSAGTAAWGDPATVLRCGVAVPGPTTQRCVGVDGIDWVASDWDVDGTIRGTRFTAYGRAPGIEVLVPADYSPEQALTDLAGAVSALEQQRQCIGRS